MVLDMSANEQKACEKDSDQHGPEESDSEEIPEVDPAPISDVSEASPPPMLKAETFDIATLKIGSMYDILDSSNRWCEGEIIKIDHDNNRVFASYLYWDSRFDEWISDVAARVAPLHANTYTQGGRMKVGQRVEVLDEQLVWREAFITDEDDARVKVHYKGYHTKFDEWINRSRTNRFIPYGRNKLVARRKQHMLWSAGAVRGSQALPNEATNRVRRIDADPRQRRIEPVSQQFLQYKRALEDQQLSITSVLGDGNCLFRSVAHQIYGSEEHHVVVRLKCMEYMEAEADFYSQFVEGGKETFPLYLAAKRKLGCWGDDPEIQAMCELYNRPAEIWAYDPTRGARKLRTFHESFNAHAHAGPIAASGLLMRLSYYGGGHYDSVVNAHHRDHVLIRKPGEVEDQRIYWSKHRHDLARLSGLVAADAVTVDLACQESRRLHSERECDDLETCLMLSLEGMKGFESKSAPPARDDRDIDLLATQGEMLRSAREESERDALEKAILSSLESSATEEELLQLALQSSQLDAAPGGLAEERAQDMDESMRLALQLSSMSDQEALELALSQSLQSPPASAELGASASTSEPTYPASEDDELRRAIAASLEVLQPQETLREYLNAHADVLPQQELEDNLDEDLMRAIQDSLRR